MVGDPLLWPLLQAALSSLKLRFTYTTLTAAIKAAHTNGVTHPTPNPIVFGRTMIKTVAVMAITKKPIPQHQLSVCIILRNIKLVSYLCIITFLNACSPDMSMAPKSSMKAKSAGRQGEPFSVEDILNGRRYLRAVKVDDRRKTKPK